MNWTAGRQAARGLAADERADQLERVLLRGLALDPSHRFASMGALADALTEVLLARHRGVRLREIMFIAASLVRMGLGKAARQPSAHRGEPHQVL